VSLVEALAQLGRRDSEAMRALAPYREALLLGRLHACANCRHFTHGPDLASLGHCQRFDVEAWPFVAFWCSGFQVSAAPTVTPYHVTRKRQAIKEDAA